MKHIDCSKMKTARNITYIFLMIYVQKAFTSFNENEKSIIFGLVHEMEIRFCISWNDDSQINDLKAFSMINLPAAQLSADRFYVFIGSILNYNIGDYNDVLKTQTFRTAIIYKGKNLNPIQNLTQIMDDKFHQIYRMSWFTWLVFLSNPDDNIYHYDLRIPLNCEFVIVQPIRENYSYKLTEIYQVKTRWFFFDFGHWDGGHLEATNISFDQRRFNLNGTIITALEVEFLKDACSKQQEPQCQIQELINGFSSAMNFKIHKILTEGDSISVTEFETNRSIDILLAPDLLYADSLPPPSRIGPIYSTMFNWYIKYPQGRLRRDYYLQPFEKSLWLAMISTLVIGTTLTLISEKLVKTKNRFLVDNIYFVFELFCNQSGNEEMKHISLQIIGLAMGITGLVAVNSFGAVITAFLAVETVKIPFNNLDQFLENGQYKLIIDNLNYTNFMYSYLKYNANPTVRIVFENYTTLSDFSNYWENNHKILCQKEKVAVYSENDFFEIIHKHALPCRIYRISQPLTKGNIILNLAKYSQFTDIFNYKLLRLYENGMQKTMEKKINQKPIKNEEKDDFTPIEIDQMVEVLSIPFLGLLLATPILVAEFICMYYKALLFREIATLFSK